MTKIVFTSSTDDYEKEMDISEINSVDDLKKEVKKSMHNGWANKATWSASLYINNSEELYNIAKQFNNYTDFINLGLVRVNILDMELVKILTHKDIHIAELDEMLQELT